MILSGEMRFGSKIATGKARCKLCRHKIVKGVKAIIIEYKDGQWWRIAQFHPKCFKELAPELD